MVIRYGDRKVERVGSTAMYACNETDKPVMYLDRKAALSWVYEAQPYVFETTEASDGYVGVVRRKADRTLLSRVYVRWDAETPEAKTKAWAAVHDWARKYGIEV